MAGESDQLASVAVLAVSATMTALPQFLPKLTDVHHATENSSMAADVRVGEVATVTFFLSVGLIASSIARSTAPMMAAIFMSVFLVTTYEMALRGTYFGMSIDNA